MRNPAFLAECRATDIELARPWLRFVEADAGSTLIEEGEEDPSLFVILDGEVEIRQGDTRLAALGPGAIVGEIAMFCDPVRTATVIAVTACRLLVVEREAYDHFRGHGSTLAGAIERAAAAQLAGRVREVEARLAAAPDAVRRAWRVEHPPAIPTPRRPAAFGYPAADRAEFLRASPLFFGADDDVLDAIADAALTETWSPGEWLGLPDELADRLVFVASGAIDVVLPDAGEAFLSCAALADGGMYGAGAMITPPRATGAIALEPTVTLSLPADIAKAWWAEDTSTASALRVAAIRALAGRLACGNARLWMLARAEEAAAAAEQEARDVAMGYRRPA